MKEKDKILIIDDEKDIVSTLKKYLDEGFEVISAFDGGTGLKLVKGEHPEVVLLDYRLPDMDGLEVLREIHQYDPQIYVIMMTAYGSQDLVVEALRKGVVDYFNKPFDLKELAESIKKFTSCEQKNFRLSIKKKTDELDKINQELSMGNLLLKKLSFFSSEITGISSFEELTQLVVKKSKELTQAGDSFLLLFDEDKKNLTPFVVGENKKFFGEIIRVLEVSLKDLKIPLTSLENPVVKAIGEKTPLKVKNLNFLGDLKDKEILKIKEAHIFPIFLSTEKPLGVLVNVFYQEVFAMTSELNLKLLVNFANQAALAIERNQVFQKIIKETYEKLDSLYETSADLIFTSDPHQVVETITQRIKAVIKYDVFGIIFTFSDKDWLVIQVLAPVSDKFIEAVKEKVIQIYQALIQREIDPRKISETIKKEKGVALAESNEAAKPGSSLTAALIISDKVFGLVNISSRQPNAFSDNDKKFFNVIVNQASMTIEGVLYEKERKYRVRLEEEREKTQRELKMAQYVQKGFLPKETPGLAGFEVAAASFPSQELGGDFYHFVPIDEHRWGIVIGDVAGRGIPAALLMAMSNTLFYEYGKNDLGPAKLLALIDGLFRKQIGLKAPLFVTAFYGILDISEDSFFYAKAGHTAPLYYEAQEKKIIPLEGDGTFLGIFEDNNFEERQKKIAPGDLIILYTDGITEAKNKQGEFFGVRKLEEVIKKNIELGPSDLLNKIYQKIQEFTDGEPPRDDITLLIIKKMGPIDDRIQKKGELEIPADLAHIYPTFEAIKQNFNLPLNFTVKLKLAFSEAMINAIKHGATGDSIKNIRISYLIDDSLIKFVITDPGRGFKIKQTPEPPESLEERGRGLIIIRSIMDEVFYNAEGNQITMIKYLKSRGGENP